MLLECYIVLDMHVLCVLRPDNYFFYSKDGFIMDGHHRWVATAMVNPAAQVGGYLVAYPGAQLIAILNDSSMFIFNHFKQI